MAEDARADVPDDLVIRVQLADPASAARRVALWDGIIIVLTATMPKLPALLQVVPDPVAGAYIFVFMVLLFRQGVRLVTTGGFGYERGLIVCISQSLTSLSCYRAV